MTRITSLLTVLALVGCAAQPTFEYRPGDIGTVGILVLVDDELSHSHVGLTVFGNSIETFPSGTFSASEYLTERSKELLGNRGYAVIPVSLPDEIHDPGDRLVAMGWSDLHVRGKYRVPLQDLVDETGVDLLIVYQTFTSQDFINKTTAPVSGYGLYTSSIFGVQVLRIYANIEAYGINGNPLGFVSGHRVLTAIPVEVSEISSETIPEIEFHVELLLERIVDAIVAELKL